ncbi:unnamed protein product [Rangifer tarandus platyrhynchus]|uniref:Uncharacterized protein n=2 Tax=Rangifer tarandus platyrhynchus TaxID=3082113 RepID=A0ABN8ZX26_RANTA|nr:unnamed protein product [Rangifer tarandus platyrhynchus]
MRIKSKRSGEICHSIRESLWTSVSELWPIGQPSWHPKKNVITNEDLGEISKMVPTKGTGEKKKNLCKRRKATLEPHESREEENGGDSGNEDEAGEEEMVE